MGNVYPDAGGLEEIYQVFDHFIIIASIIITVIANTLNIIMILIMIIRIIAMYQCIEQALKAGLNYIDTAPFYGQGK